MFDNMEEWEYNLCKDGVWRYKMPNDPAWHYMREATQREWKAKFEEEETD